LLREKAKRFSAEDNYGPQQSRSIAKAKASAADREFRKSFSCSEFLPISAGEGDGCEELLDEIMSSDGRRAQYFPKKEDSGHGPARTILAAEMNCEKALQVTVTHDIVPYALAVS